PGQCRGHLPDRPGRPVHAALDPHRPPRRTQPTGPSARRECVMTNTKPMNITMAGQRHQQPAVQEMVVIHRIFRKEFRRFPDLVRGVPDGHLRRAADVAGYATFNLDAVHNHHTAEDEYLWPLLLERARPDAALIRRMAGQHDRVAAYTEE